MSRLNSVNAEFDGQIIDLTVDFIAVDDVVEILGLIRCADIRCQISKVSVAA